MRIQDIDDAYRSYLKVSDLDNFFSIRKDKRGNYVYNLNETVYINIPDDQLLDYTTQCNCYWPLISYNLYGTTHLAWLLMKINKVSAKDVFKKIPASQNIKYVDNDYVQNILKVINGYI